MSAATAHSRHGFRGLMEAWDRRVLRRRRDANNRIVLFELIPMQDKLYSLLYRVEDERGKEAMTDLIEVASRASEALRTSSCRSLDMIELVKGLMPTAVEAAEAYTVLEGREEHGQALENALLVIVEIRMEIASVAERLQFAETEQAASIIERLTALLRRA